MNPDEVTFPYKCVRDTLRAATLLTCGFNYEGLELLPKQGRLIVAINHVHWVDPLIAAFAISRVRMPHFMAKQELFHPAIFGRFLRYLGAMPLDRSRADLYAVRSAVEILQQEGCMVLFPEGTRSKDGVPRKPKHGVSFLAHQTGAPVVPARVLNTERLRFRVPLKVRFGQPVRYEGGEGKEAYRQFAEKVMENIFRL